MKMKYIALLILALTVFSGCINEIKYSDPSDVQTGSINIEIEPITNSTPRWGKPVLNVFIDQATSSNIDGFEPNMVDMVKQAADTLSHSIGNKVRFTFINNKDTADITVKWVNKLPADSLDAIGHTYTNFTKAPSFNIIYRTDIELLTKDKRGRFLQPNDIVLLSMHEFGHAIGLGHTNDTTSIMYPTAQRGVNEPSQSDIENLLDLYKLDNLPDIKIKSANVTKSVFETSFGRKYLTDITFSILNDGLDFAQESNFTVEFGSRTLESQVIPLFPGDSYIIKYSDVSSDKDFSNVRIMADSRNQVKELDEGNNIALVPVG